MGFAEGSRQEEGRWIVRATGGDMPIRMGADHACGAVDFAMQPRPGVSVPAFSRLLPAGEGSVCVFSRFQGPDMPDEVFEAQVRALGHESVALKALNAVMEVSCPIGKAG